MSKFYIYTLLKNNAGRPLALIICNEATLEAVNAKLGIIQECRHAV